MKSAAFLALCLISLLASQALASPPESGPAASGKAQSAKAKSEWNNISAEKREAGLAKADQHKMFAKLEYASDGTATGRHVTFHFAQSIGTIHNFTAKDGTNSTVWFSAISPNAYTAGEAPYVTGSVLHIPTTNLTIRAHNNPTVLTSWQAGANNTTLTFTFASGTTNKSVAGKEVRVDNGARHGHILTNGASAPEVQTGSVIVTLQAGEKAMFRMHPLKLPDANTLHDANAAFKEGKFGGVLNVVDAGGTAVADEEEGDVDTDASEIRSGHVRVHAKAEVAGGRVLFITVGGDTLDANRIAAIVVKLDGNAVNRAPNATAARAAANASAAIVAQDGIVQVVVNIPAFSEHNVDLDQAGATSSPTGGSTAEGDSKDTPAPGLLLLLAVVATVALLRPRRGA